MEVKKGHFHVTLLLSLVIGLALADSVQNHFLPPFYRSPTPEGWTLKLVQIITRHGARTPYTILPNDPTVWYCNFDEVGLPFTSFFPDHYFPSVSASASASASSSYDPLQYASPPVPMTTRLYRRRYEQDLEVLKGNCSEGQLTAVGATQHFKLGTQMRQAYVTESKFLSPALTPSEIYIRSTDVARTIQSASMFMLGMFPVPVTLSPGLVDIIDIHVVEGSGSEYLLPSSSCYAVIEACNNQQETPQWISQYKSMQPLQRYLEAQWKITQEEFPWWGGVFNMKESRAYHGIPLPPYMNSSMVTQINNYCNYEITTAYANSTVHTLGIGRFIKVLRDNIQRAASGKPGAKFLMFSGHDITVALVLSALGTFPGIWPPFASHITLELLADQNNKLYVAIYYNGEQLSFPGCNQFCPMETVIALMNSVIPTNFKQQCQASPAFNGVPLDNFSKYMCANG